MKKKLICLLVCAALLITGAAAADTLLPMGLGFGMDPDEAAPLLAALECEESEDDCLFSLYTYEVPNAVGSLTGENVFFSWTTNNSARTLQLDCISFELPFEENVIAAFLEAVQAFTDVYGAPDDDPFLDVDSYREYGTLSAFWTKDDARISLSMGRMYGDTLSALFVRRNCYDEADLHE